MDARMHDALKHLERLPSAEIISNVAIEQIANIAQTNKSSGSTSARRTLELVEVDWPEGFLGSSSESVSFAASGIQNLREVQAEDTMAFNQLLIQLRLPTAAFTARLSYKLRAMALEYPEVIIDRLKLCRMAADEEQHGKLVVTKLPLLYRMPVALRVVGGTAVQ
jgi:hypothetical protein